jgi:DNA primase
MTVVDDIKGRLDILEVVSRHVTLQRSGRSYKANCPFHEERTPSFFVFPDRQSWRCFGGCASGGDVFSFVMRAESLEFGEVLRRLAQQTGVALPRRERRDEQQNVAGINEAARGYFQRLLASAQGSEARLYLEQRGLDRDTIEKFELGLSPPDGESLNNHLLHQGYSSGQLAIAGVVRAGEDGRHRDLFRDRLIIPIRNGQGELSGFGARALGEAEPKYLNSPRSATFDKSRILYGLHLAKEAAIEQGVVVVEGYMDAIAAHQHGFNNVVACMGTALTEYQVAEIKRLTHRVTLALDPDAAGQMATQRSLETSWVASQSRVAGKALGTALFQRQDLTEIGVALLPVGEDPDQLIRRSRKEWTALVEGASPLFDYLLAAKSAQLDLTTPQGKAKLVEEMFPIVAATPDPIQQDHYFQLLASHVGVTRETLQASVGRPTAVRRSRTAASNGPSATPSAFAKQDRDPVEDYCLAVLLRYEELGEAAEALRPEYFRRLENREIFTQWLLARQQGIEAPLAPWLKETIDDELAEHLDSLLERALPPLDSPKRPAAFQDTVGRLEGRHLRELKTEEGIRFTEEPPDLLEQEYPEVLELNRRIRDKQETRNLLEQDFSRRG